MSQQLALRILVVGGITGVATAGFHYLREYPWFLAAASGLAVGALAFLAMRTVERLHRELTTPVLEVERSPGREEQRP